jgi:lysophospholipase L1-like esterase
MTTRNTKSHKKGRAGAGPVFLAAGALCGLVGLLLPSGRAQDKPNFARWEKAIAAFEKQDQEKPPPKNAVLFAGSSSIRLWNLPKSFPGLDAINRGFGGSQIADSTHFAGRIIIKHQPRLVVLYAGDNDMAAGKSPEQILADFQAFVKTIHKDLPKTRIAFIAIKPSIARAKLSDKQQKADALVAAECKKDDRLVFIDVVKPMLGADGKPRPELFAKDGLHMNEKGYEVWTELVRPLLK